MLKPECMLEKRLNKIKVTNVLLMPKRTEKDVSKAPLNIDVLIELYGIIPQCHLLLQLILLNVKTLLDILMVKTQKTEQFTLLKNFHAFGRSLLSREIRTKSNSFYCEPS